MRLFLAALRTALAGPLILVAALLSGLAIAPASAVAEAPSPSIIPIAFENPVPALSFLGFALLASLLVAATLPMLWQRAERG